jgi:hypothetical protein
MIVRLIILALFASCTVASAGAEEIQISRFSTEGLSGWEQNSFKGETEYTMTLKNGTGGTVVKAHSAGTASALFKKINLDPKRYRYLRWSWKIAGTVSKGDEGSKAGDDYAARVYVVFPGRFFWQTKAINYIWANRLPIGQSIPNAFAGNAMMVAVESGPSKAGQWMNEVRDILDDYRRLFGEEPHRAGAIAIMTDTDNTGSEATAWYGDIVIKSDL